MTKNKEVVELPTEMIKALTPLPELTELRLGVATDTLLVLTGIAEDGDEVTITTAMTKEESAKWDGVQSGTALTYVGVDSVVVGAPLDMINREAGSATPDVHEQKLMSNH